MKQKFIIRGEFLLPDNFSGGFLDALDLYAKHCRETWDNQPRFPSSLPDEFCFPFAVRNGGQSYTSFSIESFKFNDLEEPLELDEELQEEMEQELNVWNDPDRDV